MKYIEVKGARENNLKNVTLKIPKESLTVVTGVSGSGKSSLVFDVLFNEGQRRFLSSLDTYARRFTHQMKKPDVDFVYGLSPVLAISQKKGLRNPRSTVGTLTDIADYLRVLYATSSEVECPCCQNHFRSKSTHQIVEHLMSLDTGTLVALYAKVNPSYGDSLKETLDHFRMKGYRTFRIDGALHIPSESDSLKKCYSSHIDVLVDEVEISDGTYKALTEVVEEALTIGECFICVDVITRSMTDENLRKFYNKLGCAEHHILVGELKPYYFSSNESDSACTTCRGLGVYRKAEARLMVDFEHKSIRKGALTNTFLNLKHPGKYMMMYSLAKHYNFSLDEPFYTLSDAAKHIIFYGTDGEKILQIQPETAKTAHSDVGKYLQYHGLIPPLDAAYRKASKKGDAEYMGDFIFKKHMSEFRCPACNGTKLRQSRSQFKIGGMTYYELGELSVDALLEKMQSLQSNEQHQLSIQVIQEIITRLNLLVEVGVSYLNLNRGADTISGGEAQRIKLSTQISSGLSGMLYVLDEPSIGLHPRDSEKIIKTMQRLRDSGNTVVVVEHDVDTMLAADYLVEIGPKSGEEGGHVTFQGSFKEMILDPQCLTGRYLAGEKTIERPLIRRKPENWITVQGAHENNLKHVNVSIPLSLFCCVTGVSGSGKSSLIHEVLSKTLQHHFYDKRVHPGKHLKITGYERLTHMINIDQSPIGRSSRSNPATYVGFYDAIRTLFAQTEEAIHRNYDKSYFSANNKYGRCDECLGHGHIVREFQFMPPVETSCKACKGTGFSKEILEILYEGKSISDVLNLSVLEALSFFKNHKYIAHKLSIMKDLGLGYLKIGQSSSTLSGGEAQRIKLSAELSKLKKGAHNLYILDEPTTGLHLEDIKPLLLCFNRLVEVGHSVIVIEHHLEVIKSADYVIDVGPEAGIKGGEIVAVGTPEEVMRVEGSYTGHFLRKALQVD